MSLVQVDVSHVSTSSILSRIILQVRYRVIATACRWSGERSASTRRRGVEFHSPGKAAPVACRPPLYVPPSISWRCGRGRGHGRNAIDRARCRILCSARSTLPADLLPQCRMRVRGRYFAIPKLNRSACHVSVLTCAAYMMSGISWTAEPSPERRRVAVRLSGCIAVMPTNDAVITNTNPQSRFANRNDLAHQTPINAAAAGAFEWMQVPQAS